MTIRVTAFGQIKRYIENYCGKISLPDDARLADLLHYIDRHWSKELPEYLWNKDKMGSKLYNKITSTTLNDIIRRNTDLSENSDDDLPQKIFFV